MQAVLKQGTDSFGPIKLNKDDLKIALVDDNDNSVGFRLEVRSKSRSGASDYGVNKKRINYLAEALRNKGWDAPKVVYGIGSYDAFF